MKNFLVSLLLLAFAPSAMAVTRVEALGDQFKLNQSNPNAMGETRLGDKVVAETLRTMRASYSFATQGGAVGSANFLDVSTGKAAVLPKGAIVRHCIIDVITPGTTSASGTLAITLQSAGDIKAALAAASYTGLLACIPVGTAATAIKLTADRTLVGTIATGALTAIKAYVVIQYELSDTL